MKTTDYLTLFLLIAVFISALLLVVIRHNNQQAFIQLYELQQQRDELITQWGQLQLEQSTWAQHHRIETIAHQQLNMIIPQNIIVIKPQ